MTLILSPYEKVMYATLSPIYSSSDSQIASIISFIPGNPIIVIRRVPRSLRHSTIAIDVHQIVSSDVMEPSDPSTLSTYLPTPTFP
mmetsp:Transcript_5999/g.13049  ORF Transcript_5999/g.13049 Transcript_5999/m.13049 type:complete len:86 (-) Transcript_5999:555-812(-)